MNVKKFSSKSASLLVSASLILAPTTSHADLDTVLGSMFGDYVHVNSGGALSTEKRGGFYGGSVYVRNQVVDVAVVNFTPPSFSSGCGGVDMFGGSFAMINAEQFVQLLRNIAMNAAGYAFQLALKNICEQCATIIAGLQKAIQAMNEFTGNSCQLAQGIVNQGIEALEIKDVKGLQGQTITQGWNDAWNGFWGGLSESVTAMNTTVGGVNLYQDDYVVNVVWKAIIDINDSFNTSAAVGLRQDIMTLTGSVILDGPFDDEDGNPSRNITRLAGYKFTVTDMVYGNSSINRYYCQSEFTKCLDVTEENVEVTGLVEHIREQFMGSGPTDNTSIIWQLVNGTDGQMDGAREAMITSLGYIGGMLIRLAVNSPPGSNVVYRAFEDHSEYLAIELAQSFVDQTITAVDQELSHTQYDVAWAEDWRRQDFQNTIDRISAEFSNLYSAVDRPDVTKYIVQLEHLISTNPFAD